MNPYTLQRKKVILVLGGSQSGRKDLLMMLLDEDQKNKLRIESSNDKKSKCQFYEMSH